MKHLSPLRETQPTAAEQRATLHNILEGHHSLRSQFNAATTACIELSIQTCLPDHIVEMFINFSQKCIEHGDMDTARLAYSYAKKKPMPDGMLQRGRLEKQRRLTDLEIAALHL